MKSDSILRVCLLFLWCYKVNFILISVFFIYVSHLSLNWEKSSKRRFRCDDFPENVHLDQITAPITTDHTTIGATHKLPTNSTDGLFAFLHKPTTEHYIKSHRKGRMTDKERMPTNASVFSAFAAAAVVTAAGFVVVIRNCFDCYFGPNLYKHTHTRKLHIQ